jgi:hypothetical protein
MHEYKGKTIFRKDPANIEAKSRVAPRRGGQSSSATTGMCMALHPAFDESNSHIFCTSQLLPAVCLILRCPADDSAKARKSVVPK